MQTLYEPNATLDVIGRINKLQANTLHQWGKMDVAQMLAHCSESLSMAMGTKEVKRSFISRIIGPMFKKKMMGDVPFDKNLPTAKEIKMHGSKDFTEEQQRLVAAIKTFNAAGRAGVPPHVHPLLGKLTTDEWGMNAYKHLDHHLKQFGV